MLNIRQQASSARCGRCWCWLWWGRRPGDPLSPQTAVDAARRLTLMSQSHIEATGQQHHETSSQEFPTSITSRNGLFVSWPAGASPKSSPMLMWTSMASRDQSFHQSADGGSHSGRGCGADSPRAAGGRRHRPHQGRLLRGDPAGGDFGDCGPDSRCHRPRAGGAVPVYPDRSI